MYRVGLLGSLLVIGLGACKNKPSDVSTTSSGAGSAPIASVGSNAGSNAVSATAGSSAPPAMAADARAKDLLQHQIDAALKNDHAGFNATFAPDAVVFVPGKGPTTPDDDTSGVLGGSGPDGAKITKSTIAKLVANGTADAVWFYAEVTEADPDDPKVVPSTTHVVELLAADKGWHVIAASFDEGHEIHPSGDNIEAPGATPPDGPLAKLVPPSALGAAAAPEAIIVGAKGMTDLAGLKPLEPLTIYKSAKETHAATYGYLQATADHPRSNRKLVERVNVQLFAVPNADKTWKIVLAQYGGQ